MDGVSGIVRKRIHHTIRCKDGSLKDVELTRDRAIKLMCTECLGFETHPKDCTSSLCPLYPYRKKTLLGYIGGGDTGDDEGDVTGGDECDTEWIEIIRQEMEDERQQAYDH